MGPFEIYFPSKKNEKILELFKEGKDVAFSKVMQVGRYISADAAFEKVISLVKLGVLKNISLINSKFVTIKDKE